MTTALADVLAAAESLSAEERLELIELLYEGLDHLGGVKEPPALTAAWREEVNRRSAAYDAGQAETVPWQEVQARLRSQEDM